MNRKRQLSEREQEALTFARSNYPHWRKRFSVTLADHMKQRPTGIKIDVWRSWYFWPCGDHRMCVNFQIVRRLLKQQVV